MKQFVMPKKPSGWNNSEHTFWLQLREALDALAKEVDTSDLSKELMGKISQNYVSTYDSLPEAASDFRGKFGLVSEGGTDSLYVCVQKGDEYAWKRVTLTDVSPDTPTGDTVFFDGGFVDGIVWVGNIYPRVNYYSIARYNMSYATSDGYMLLYVESSTGNVVSYNCHFATQGMVTVPSGAASIKVDANWKTNAMQMAVGLLPENAPDSVSVVNGGFMSGYFETTGNRQTYTIPIPEALRGRTDLRLVINGRGNSGKNSERRNLQIHKVWFE